MRGAAPALLACQSTIVHCSSGADSNSITANGTLLLVRALTALHSLSNYATFYIIQIFAL